VPTEEPLNIDPEKQHPEGQEQPPQPRKKRFFPSLSLQRASYYPDTSPYDSTQPGSPPPPSGYPPTSPFDSPGAPPPLPFDDSPTLRRRFLFSSLPRPIVAVAWLASIVLAMIVVFVATSSGWIGGSHGKISLTPAKSTASPAAQNTQVVTLATTTPGSRPSSGTPGGMAPTAQATNAPIHAPTATSASAPTATAAPKGCTFYDLSGHSDTNYQTIGATTIKIHAQLQWDLNSNGVWCGNLRTVLSVTATGPNVSGTATSTLPYGPPGGPFPYKTVSGSKTGVTPLLSIVAGPQKAPCGAPLGSFVGSGFNVSAVASNFCP
jgi:hypothetical protein